jgi:hypothetical protein
LLLVFAVRVVFVVREEGEAFPVEDKGDLKGDQLRERKVSVRRWRSDGKSDGGDEVQEWRKGEKGG